MVNWTNDRNERSWLSRINIVTLMLVDRQRLRKYIPAGANARDDRTSIARQRRGKQASQQYRLCFRYGPRRDVIKGHKGRGRIERERLVEYNSHL
jgi:hypothetical protein